MNAQHIDTFPERWAAAIAEVEYVNRDGDYGTKRYVFNRKEIEENEAQRDPEFTNFPEGQFETLVYQKIVDLFRQPIVIEGDTPLERIVLPPTRIARITLQVEPLPRLALPS